MAPRAAGLGEDPAVDRDARRAVRANGGHDVQIAAVELRFEIRALGVADLLVVLDGQLVAVESDLETAHRVGVLAGDRSLVDAGVVLSEDQIEEIDELRPAAAGHTYALVP